MSTALLFSPEMAAAKLSLSRTAIFNLMRAGELQSIKIGRARRIPAAVLEEYVERLQREQAPASATTP